MADGASPSEADGEERLRALRETDDDGAASDEENAAEEDTRETVVGMSVIELACADPTLAVAAAAAE
jgi:hypothetical protein